MPSAGEFSVGWQASVVVAVVLAGGGALLAGLGNRDTSRVQALEDRVERLEGKIKSLQTPGGSADPKAKDPFYGE
jgi:hypothetical protein